MIQKFETTLERREVDAYGEKKFNRVNFSAQKARIEWTAEIALYSYGFEYILTVQRVFIDYDYDNEEGDVMTDGLMMWTPKKTKTEILRGSSMIGIDRIEINFDEDIIELSV